MSQAHFYGLGRYIWFWEPICYLCLIQLIWKFAFLLIFVVPEISVRFGYLPYFFDLTESTRTFLLVSDENPTMSHAGFNSFYLLISLGWCDKGDHIYAGAITFTPWRSHLAQGMPCARPGKLNVHAPAITFVPCAGSCNFLHGIATPGTRHECDRRGMYI